MLVALALQGVLRLAAVVGIKEVLQLAGLEEEHLQDLERFASDTKRHHKGFHAWSFGRKSSAVRCAWSLPPTNPDEWYRVSSKRHTTCLGLCLENRPVCMA